MLPTLSTIGTAAMTLIALVGQVIMVGTGLGLGMWLSVQLTGALDNLLTNRKQKKAVKLSAQKAASL